MGQLDRKIAIITGGGSGIGKGIARAFAREGATLVLASRKQQQLELAAGELRTDGATVLVVPADVTDEAQVIALFERTIGEFGRLDILVNNSGVFDGGAIEELSLATWRKVLDVNLTGPFLCSREAMKIMKPQGGGRIINIGSISAQMPRENAAPYAAPSVVLTVTSSASSTSARICRHSKLFAPPPDTRTSSTDPSPASRIRQNISLIPNATPSSIDRVKCGWP